MIKNNVDIKNKTILITGTAGFIGSNLVIEYCRGIVKEFFLPIAEQIWLDVILGCKGVEIFLALKQLDYQV